jgi:hypothetical protein
VLAASYRPNPQPCGALICFPPACPVSPERLREFPRKRFLPRATRLPRPVRDVNPFRIRTSKTPWPQLLCNPHFHVSLASAHSKGFADSSILPQLPWNQHFRAPFASAGNNGLVTPSESALTKISRLTPVESALPENRGDGPSTSPLPALRCVVISPSSPQVNPELVYGGRRFSRGAFALSTLTTLLFLTHLPVSAAQRALPICRLRPSGRCGRILPVPALLSIPLAKPAQPRLIHSRRASVAEKQGQTS